MNDFCIFDGPMMPDCSNLMWELMDKMYSKGSNDSFTAEVYEDVWYKEIIDNLGYIVTVSNAGVLVMNLQSDIYPRVDDEGTLELSDNPLPYVDDAGILIVE